MIKWVVAISLLGGNAEISMGPYETLQDCLAHMSEAFEQMLPTIRNVAKNETPSAHLVNAAPSCRAIISVEED